MPTNEIQAPFYIKGKIATPSYPLGHAFRLYFRSGTTLSVGLVGEENDWRITRGGDDKGSIAFMIHDLYYRAAALMPANSHVTELALWQSIPNALNNLLHLNTLPVSNTFGVGAGIASAYTMGVYADNLKHLFKFTFFDGANVQPQRFPPDSPPVGDDVSLAWFFTRSDYGLATNDGLALSRMVSNNTGYNRALATSYGRTINP